MGVPCFFNPLLSVWILDEKTAFHFEYIASNTNHYIVISMVSYCGKLSFPYIQLILIFKPIFFLLISMAFLFCTNRYMYCRDIHFFTAMLLTYHLAISIFVMAISCKGIKMSSIPGAYWQSCFHTRLASPLFGLLYFVPSLHHLNAWKRLTLYSLGLCEETM